MSNPSNISSNSPGKVLFFGGYSILEFGNIGFALGVVDKQGKGVYSRIRIGEKRIISKEFGIDEEPSFESPHLISKAYAVGEAYLKAKNKWRNDLEVELFNSPIFGTKEEKSGLGSSAASTTTVIKSLFVGNKLDPEFHKETIFKLSQFAYALFSNKIGSGFDIAVSSFEKTIKYKRYDPNEIDFNSLEKSVDKPWNEVSVIEAKVPKKYGILLYNIKTAKTSSIKAVKGFKKLKKENPELVRELLSKQNEVEIKGIEAFENGNDGELRAYTHKAREVHKRLSEEIMRVELIDPIEPEELTYVIEKAEEIKGVIAGRAPGAGGYDSLAFIINKLDFSEANIEEIRKFGEDVGLKLERIEVKLL